MQLKQFALTALLLLALPVSAQDAELEANQEPIVFELPNVQPEGVVYDEAGARFLFGSLTQGTIFEITEGGVPEPFIEDDQLSSTVGIHIDAANNRLLVPNSEAGVFTDPSALGAAGLASYDLESGERIFYADLAALLPEGRHFVNDVTVDADGNAYVTDSFSPVIYKVDLEGNAEVFLEDDQFTSETFGLNGIDYHPDGYLLAAVTGNGALFKIPLDDPSTFSEVVLSEPLGIDGMVLLPDGGAFYAVATTFEESPEGMQSLVGVSSSDDWATGEVTARTDTGGNATTIALRDGIPYYINAYLNDTTIEEYQIVPGIFEAVG